VSHARRGQRSASSGRVAVRLAGAVLSVLCVLTGCSTLPPQQARQASHALLDTAQTRLGVAVESNLANHPGLSGFIPMSTGPDALVARFALARAADRTLDVQYYDFHADAIGAALLHELIAAADRGVRVRLLLDDLHTKGKDDILAAVDSHPNLEVRLFNPFVHRHARWIDFLGNYARVNRRMHNKSMTADSQITIVGGRNIGDEYFDAPAALEFSDFDVMAFGPAVAEVSAEFDDYWNSDVAYPIAALLGTPSSTHPDLAEVRRQLEQHMQKLRSTPYATALTSADLARSLVQKDVTVYWGRSTLIADRPAKVTLPPEDSSTHAMPKLRERLEQAQGELILVSPYFVPGKSGTRWLQDMASHGVTIKVLTNSYAAMDVPGVMAAYSAYRKDLLRSGIELYELKPSLVHGLESEADEHSSKSTKSSLHAKSYMADARTIFVGSMNLDPRSVALNTEMGLVIESATLGAHIREGLLPRLPEIAYRVELDTRSDPKGQLAWVTQEHGRDMRYSSEPGMSPWDSFVRTLQRALPIENQL
jgi:cardiolipin synthase C